MLPLKRGKSVTFGRFSCLLQVKAMKIRPKNPGGAFLGACLSLLVGALCSEAWGASFLSDPVSLTLRGGWESPTPAVRQIKVVLPHAYLVVGGDKIYILDVTDPDLPRELNHYQAAKPINDLQVPSNRVYLVEASDYEATNGVLEILDVSNATNTSLIGSVATLGMPNRVAVQGDHVYVAERLRAGSDSLGVMEVFCVSNPASPVLVGQLETSAPINDIKLADGHAYLAGGNAALTILDTRDPASPRWVGAFHTNGPDGQSFSGETVEVKEGRAYVVTSSGFFILDVRDPAHPVRVSDVLPRNHKGAALSFLIRPTDRYASLTVMVLQAWNEWTSAGTAFYDMSNPSDWLALGDLAFPDTLADLQLIDGRAYAATTYGLWIYDISVLPYFKSTARSGGKLVLSWNREAGLRLQRATSLNSPDWTDVPKPEGQSRMELPVGAGAEFFRLVKP